MPVKTSAAKTRKPAAKTPRAEPVETPENLAEDTPVSGIRPAGPGRTRDESTLPFEAGGESLESTAGAIAALKVRVARQFGEIEQGLMGEYARLDAVRKAIVEAEARVAEIHAIEAEAGTLAALREAHEKERKEFRQEMDEARTQGEKEQRDHEAQVKERDAAAKRERVREEEEYQYQTKQSRQREADAADAELAQKRHAFEVATREREMALSSRGEAIKAQEGELAELRKQVVTFPAQIEKDVRSAESRAIKATEERFAFEKTLLERDIEHERKMFQATIATLQEKSKEQEARIRALEKDLKDSAAQAQSVTARAIEGIAGLKPAPQAPESPREPQGSGR